ncbi:MAG: GNAT family protein [Candidatus Woesearchaeota archaeon]
MKNLPIIPGKTIYLGPVPDTPKFYQEYLSWLNQDRVKKGTGSDSLTLEEVTQMHQEWRNDPKNITFCIFEAQTNEPIGDINLRYGVENYDNDGPETAIMIGKNFGQGKGREAMNLLLDYAFKTLNLPIINLSVYKDNHPAVKLYQGLGFKTVKEGLDEGKEEYIMELKKEEWIK